MVVVLSATNDVLSAPIEKGADILAELNAAVADVKPPESEPVSDFNAILDKLEVDLDNALKQKSEEAVRKVIEEGKAAFQAEKAVREKGLHDAQEKHQKLLGESGAADPLVIEADKEMKSWQESLEGFTAFISEQNEYYDDVLADMQAPQEQAIVTEPDEEIEIPKTREAYIAKLQELKTAYLARLDELDAEEKALGKKLQDAKIAQLKASVGAIT